MRAGLGSTARWLHYNGRFHTRQRFPPIFLMNLTTLALLVLTPLLVWRVYSRLKTQMARQRSILSRHWTGVLVFTAMIAVPVSELMRMDRPLPLAALGVGTLAGIAYAVWGLRLTRFETTSEGYFFTPNARLGVVVAMLLAARVLYIGVELYANQGSGVPAARFTDSPLTMLIVGVTAAYFATYSAALLRWRAKLKKAVRQ
jgi:hypothetical protein